MIEIYQNPLDYEALQFTCAFSPALADVPASAVVWIERQSATTERTTTEHAATLQAGATTSAATATYVPTGEFAAVGRYTLTVRFKNAGGAVIARTVPQSISVLPYPPGPT